MTTKIHDFVSVYVWMVPWKSFLGFVFKIFEKRKKFFLTISTSKGPPFGKKIKDCQKPIFFRTIILFFFLNLYSTCSKLSFEVYNSHVSKNFKFWPIFMWKISFFATVFWQPAWPKLHFIKCFFCQQKIKRFRWKSILGFRMPTDRFRMAITHPGHNGPPLLQNVYSRPYSG